MAGERLVFQNNGTVVGKIETMSLGGINTSGSPVGDVPPVPTNNVTVKVPETYEAIDLQDTPVVLSTSTEDHYGTVKTVDARLGQDFASLSIDPVLSKLNQEVALFPAWGAAKDAIPGYITQLFNQCGVTKWAIPGQLTHAFEYSGSSTRGIVSGDVYTYYKSGTSNSMWSLDIYGNYSASDLSLAGTTKILVGIDAKVSTLKVGEVATFYFGRTADTAGEGDENPQQDFTSTQAIQLSIVSIGSWSATSAGSITFRVSDPNGSGGVNLVLALPLGTLLENSSIRFSISPQLSASPTDNTVALSAGVWDHYDFIGPYTASTTGRYSAGGFQGQYKLLSVVKPATGVLAYLYNSAEVFDVVNARNVYPRSFAFSTTAGNRSVALPGVTGSGWSILQDLLFANGMLFEAVSGEFTDKSVADLKEYSPREVGYQAGPVQVSTSSRDSAARCSITAYDYTIPANNTPIRLWTATESYSVSVGEVQTFTVDLEDGTSVSAIEPPNAMPGADFGKLVGAGKGSESGYMVYTSDGLPINDTSNWYANGGGLTASVGENSSQIVLTLTGPSSRIYPGNDDHDNGTYTIELAPGAGNKGIVLAGIGLKSNKRKVETLTGAQRANSKEVPVEYDNKFVSTNDALWNTAADLANYYGGNSVTASTTLSALNSTEPFGSDEPPVHMRIGPYPLKVREYSRVPGGVTIQNVELGATVGAVDTMYAGKTVGDVDTAKAGTILKQDALRPYGKDLK